MRNNQRDSSPPRRMGLKGIALALIFAGLGAEVAQARPGYITMDQYLRNVHKREVFRHRHVSSKTIDLYNHRIEVLERAVLKLRVQNRRLRGEIADLETNARVRMAEVR